MDLRTRVDLRTLVAPLLPLCVVACAAASPVTPPPRAPGSGGPTVTVPPVVVSPYTDGELAEQFERARTQLLEGKFREAAEAFDRLVRLAPDGRTAGPSLYNAGVAWEALAERQTAIDRYREQLRRFPDLPTSRSGLLRIGRLEAYLERWPELVETAAQLGGRTDLALLERIEGLGLSGLGLVEQDRVEDAKRAIYLARDLIEDNRLGEAGKPPLELAPVSFALGEIRKKESEKITFVPMPPNFADILEQRCQGLLDAQSAYMEAMRSLDAHWSAMAGYRVGQLYQDLHRDVMRIPPPSKADSLQRKQLFEGAMRLRYRILLEKGLKMMDATARIGDRTGEASAWIGRAREAKRDLERALEDEKAALSKLPFTEAELQAALDALKKPKP